MPATTRLLFVLILSAFFLSLLACGPSRDRGRGGSPVIIIASDGGHVADTGVHDPDTPVIEPPADTGTTDSGPTEDTQVADADADPDPEPCGGCPSGEVCVGEVCEAIPVECPCPSESYCDLATNRCIAGCTTDENCLDGRICNEVDRACRTGCRQDSQCTQANQICDGSTLTCRTGCRQDGDCPGQDRICDGSSQTCRDGCREHSHCGDEELCTSTLCVAGCRNDGECLGDRICVNDLCREGCRANSDCDFPDVCSNDLVCVPDGFVDISAGHDFTCAVLATSNKPICWGKDDFGQATPLDEIFHQIEAGKNLACGRRYGTVKCWGETEYGGTTVPDISGFQFTDVSVDDQYACGATSRNEGERICWGRNLYGRAPGTHSFSNIAFRYMRTSPRRACALIRPPSLDSTCWGEQATHQPAGNLLDMDLGTNFIIVVRQNGDLYALNVTDGTAPFTVPSGTYTQVVAGLAFACARSSTGEVSCFGGNNT
ncbi:MAG: hypothetical protein ACNA8W_24970, partial [Bradymonadaceae bacterium]